MASANRAEPPQDKKEYLITTYCLKKAMSGLKGSPRREETAANYTKVSLAQNGKSGDTLVHHLCKLSWQALEECLSLKELAKVPKQIQNTKPWEGFPCTGSSFS